MVIVVIIMQGAVYSWPTDIVLLNILKYKIVILFIQILKKIAIELYL